MCLSIVRFVRLLVKPKFTEEEIESEISAIDAEYQRNRDLKTWRLFALLQAVSDPKHSFSRFRIGNYETLRDTPSKANTDVRKALIAFHKKWYSSNIMSLVIYGSRMSHCYITFKAFLMT